MVRIHCMWIWVSKFVHVLLFPPGCFFYCSYFCMLSHWLAVGFVQFDIWCDTSVRTHYILWDISIFFGNRFSNIHCATQLKLFSSTLDYYAAQLCDLTSVPNFMVFPLSLSIVLLSLLLSCGQTTNHNYIAKCASFSIKCMRKYIRDGIWIA